MWTYTGTRFDEKTPNNVLIFFFFFFDLTRQNKKAEFQPLSGSKNGMVKESRKVPSCTREKAGNN